MSCAKHPRLRSFVAHRRDLGGGADNDRSFTPPSGCALARRSQSGNRAVSIACPSVWPRERTAPPPRPAWPRRFVDQAPPSGLAADRPERQLARRPPDSRVAEGPNPWTEAVMREKATSCCAVLSSAGGGVDPCQIVISGREAQQDHVAASGTMRDQIRQQVLETAGVRDLAVRDGRLDSVGIGERPDGVSRRHPPGKSQNRVNHGDARECARAYRRHLPTRMARQRRMPARQGGPACRRSPDGI